MNNKLGLVLSLFITILIMDSCAPVKTGMFYIDSQTGNDANNGSSPQKAWSSFAHINEKTLKPGDQVLIRAGTSYNGQLKIKGSGTIDKPIVVTSYGEGEKPLLNGNGEEKYTLRVKNSEYIEISNLSITNTGKAREAGRVGVLIEAIDCGDMHHIYLDNLDIHDVNGSLVKKDGGGSAIFWLNKGDSIPTRFIDLRIENCHLYRCGRNGITSTGNTSRKKWYPSLGIKIRGNLLEDIPGDGIVPIGCDSTIIEFNVMRNSPDSLSFDEAAAGIWPWSSDNTVIQYNEVSGHRAKWDGQAYDCDFNCIGTTIQYNYSHDNYGGFLLVCNPGDLVPEEINVGTKKSIVQYNLSVNDGIRPYPTRQQGWFSPTIHLTGPAENTIINHNIFIIPRKALTKIPATFIAVGDWGDAWPVQSVIESNHIYTDEEVKNNWGKGENIIYRHNSIMTLDGSKNEQMILNQIDKIIANSNPAAREGYEKLSHFIKGRSEVY